MTLLFTKDYKAYDVIIDSQRYRIIARSCREAINIAKFKYCYMMCLSRISHYSVVDRIELKRAIKEFDKTLLQLALEGQVVSSGELSADKRQTTRQWKLLQEFEREQLIEDMKAHEEMMAS